MKTAQLKLPLHCYDEAGRIKPPLWLNLVFLVCLADWIILVFALAIRDQTTFLLALFYPSRLTLGLSLVSGAPALLALVLISRREKQWQQQRYRWSRYILPLVAVSLVAQVSLQVVPLMAQFWRFQPVVAARMLASVCACYALIKSRHLRWMVADWRLPN